MQKLCKFIIGPANHRISSATTCPFNVFGSAWTEKTPPHMAHPHQRALAFYRREQFVVQSEEIDEDTNEAEIQMLWMRQA